MPCLAFVAGCARACASQILDYQRVIVVIPPLYSGGEHAPSYVPLGRPLMATEGSNAAHEEADHLAPEEGGGPWTVYQK